MNIFCLFNVVGGITCLDKVLSVENVVDSKVPTKLVHSLIICNSPGITRVCVLTAVANEELK